MMKNKAVMRMEPNKKRIEENPLPGIQPEHFVLDSVHGLYWFDYEGERHKVVKLGICANGVRDLCIYWHGPIMTDVRVGKIAEVAKEHILWIPRGDILQFNFQPPLVDGTHSFFMDAGDPAIKDMVRKTLSLFPATQKGSEYAKFGGDKYE